MDAAPIPLADIEAAERRLAGHAVTTPLLESRDLSRRAGGRVLVKPEVLQRTGSFKFRGAFNKLSSLAGPERRNGVVAFSSGNHGQAVAAAAAELGMPAVIVMPQDAPAVKIERTRAFGAEIVLFDRHTDDRAAMARGLAEARQAVLVPPFDDPMIMAGQGTIGSELARQARQLDAGLDHVLTPCGGGGLIAGVASALHALSPPTRVTAVEPAGFDDTGRSLVAGERLTNPSLAGSICDALLSPTPGALTFPINHRLLAGGLAVSDEEVRAAMAYAFAELRLVVEPGGAVALAAVLTGRFRAEGATTALVLSGGNVDPALYAATIAGR
ncbi:threonine ammonia-lyase [Labrys wisconsinensis]|uniref:Threonine dehydratase n=1 Tax=Labrys wisconsinensis TaxID=425677 RepID=A0ABU0JK38_9HYPH|nr:threonine/serine dehydratase [Labrys wisconsinensis]MDQ0473624.1 threonine dehydratase [Labrys wisconsinensis]